MEELLTVDEVAKILKVSPIWVRQHACGLRKPIIRSSKMGKFVRFRTEDIQQFIKEQEQFRPKSVTLPSNS